MYFSEQAMKKVLQIANNTGRRSLLDVGTGNCEHAKVFCEHGLKVKGVDIKRPSFKHENYKFHLGFFDEYEDTKKYDFVWASHVLEHMLDPHFFLTKAKTLLKDEGFLVVTVPPLKHQIVGGHVNLFNAGILLYRLILAGFDCSSAKVCKYGYNISVIVRNSEIESGAFKDLNYDSGDIEKLAPYFPPGCRKQGFYGDIDLINWT